jgi:hypothetical protein
MSETTPLPPTDYEPHDAPPRRVAIVAACLAGGILLSLAISLALYALRYDNAPSLGTMGRQTSFRHSPDATTDIAADWQRAEAEFSAHLSSYGWVDRDAGIVRIPIDRAMQRVLDDASAPPRSSP